MEQYLRLVGRYLDEQGLIGEGRAEDVVDLKALRDNLALTSAKDAMEIVERYIPGNLLTPRVGLLLEVIFEQE